MDNARLTGIWGAFFAVCIWIAPVFSGDLSNDPDRHRFTSQGEFVTPSGDYTRSSFSPKSGRGEFSGKSFSLTENEGQFTDTSFSVYGKEKGEMTKPSFKLSDDKNRGEFSENSFTLSGKSGEFSKPSFSVSEGQGQYTQSPMRMYSGTQTLKDEE
jgi:hypothetical protein